MFHITHRLSVLSSLAVLTGAVLFVHVQPTLAATADSQQVWKTSKSAADYTSADLPFATDHILVKPVNGSVMRVQIESADQLADALAAWNANPDVEYAETDNLYHTTSQEESWGFTTVKAGEAASTNAATGTGIKVAVVDSGVDYNHEDLDANNWVNTSETADDGLDNDHNGYVDDVYGYDFMGSFFTAVTPDNDPMDELFHGTHVAGIIAAENNSFGVRGIAPSATIMPVKVLDAEGYGWDATIADGIRYAADNGADIINMSLGGSQASHTMSDAVDYAQSQGVLVIAAAGNENTFTGASYPADYSNVVSVGATNDDGYKAYFSNWGKVDVVAPGVDILSTTPGNQYEKLSGTSMASPHVAGVAALIAQDSSLSNNPRALRHVLETTTDDFGTQTGPDYVAGQGMIDALKATGTLSTAGFLYADAGWIKADGSDSAVITISLRNASNQPLPGQTVNWSTSMGTLAAGSSTTNSSGEASTTLLADDVDGLAVISATTGLLSSAVTMQIAIVPDTVTPETIGVIPYSTASEDDSVNIADDGYSTGTSSNMYAAGDEIQIWSQATAWDRETHDDVTMTYSVTDPDGNDVSDLDGTTESTSIGQDYYGIWYFGQSQMTSAPLTIPATAGNGEYTLTVTITDNNSGETASRTSTFWVGELPDILLVYDTGYCWDTPVQGLDFGGIPLCTHAGHALQAELENLGYDVMLWDTTNLGTPYDTDLIQFPAVVWASADLTWTDTTTLQSYLDQGGNLLLSDELLAANEGWSGTPSDFLWNYMHARWVSSQIIPDMVNGVSGGLFDGLSFNIDYYNLNGSGVHDDFYADEIALNTADDAEALFSYNVGNSSDMTAGVRVATDTYRAAFLAFGLEAINDGSGDSTTAHVLGSLMIWLLGSGPSIDSVSNGHLNNSTDRTITIKGHGFQPTGTTTVKIDSTELSGVTVMSRTKIQAIVPAGTPAKVYDLKVINPDGRKTSKAKGVHVSVGGPIITSLSQAFASNNTDRKIVVTGENFKTGSTAFLGATPLTSVVDNATQMTVTIPTGLAVKMYSLKIVNPSGEKDILQQAVKVRVGFDTELASGDTNAQVKTLKKRLTVYGYFSGKITGVFDTPTENAVELYQKALAIPITGQLDFLTRYSLNTNE